MQVPTKRIVADVTDANPHGYIVINESDFDEAVHEAWSPAPAKDDDGGEREPVKPPPASAPASPPKYGRK